VLIDGGGELARGSCEVATNAERAGALFGGEQYELRLERACGGIKVFVRVVGGFDEFSGIDS